MLETVRNNLFNRTGRSVTKGKLDSPRWSRFVDKEEFKSVCAKHGIPTIESLFVFEDLDELKARFDELPHSFMAKSTKGSGRNVLVKNKDSWTPEKLAEKLEDYDKNFSSFEKQYNHKKARIIIEKALEPVPEDIKVVVSKYKPTLVWVDQDRFGDHRRLPYRVKNNGFEKLDCFWHYKNSDNKSIIDDLSKDETAFILDKSVALARDVGLDLVRIDFYKLHDGIYGGEVTLTSGAYMEDIDTECATIAIEGEYKEKQEGGNQTSIALFVILGALFALLLFLMISSKKKPASQH